MVDTADTALSVSQGPLAAQFNAPSDVTVDAAGIVYVADRGNHAIRKITGTKVITLAGDGSIGDLENWQPLGKNMAAFNNPRAVSVDDKGNLYISDSGNFKIKKFTPDGWLYLLSGSGVSGRSLGDLAPGSNKIDASGDSNPYTCEYVLPTFSDIDKSGHLYVVDVDAIGGTRLLSIDRDGVPNVVCDFNGSDGDSSVSVAVSPGQKLFVTMNA